MDHESSETMIPGHGRQHVTMVESAGEPHRLQIALGDDSRRASQDYDGFEDLPDDGPGIPGECPDY